MGYGGGSCGCHCYNVADALTSTDDVVISDRCRERVVKGTWFLSRLVESVALTKDGNNLTVTLTMADGSTKASTVSLV